MVIHPDKDTDALPLQRIQKDAILRQMHEYKREKAALETRLGDAKQAAEHHDSHIRAIDSWFSQVSLTYDP